MSNPIVWLYLLVQWDLNFKNSHYYSNIASDNSFTFNSNSYVVE